MPTVGETGWGTLVNENFSTIDTFLKPISLSGSTYTFTGNHVGNQSGGTITATKITNSGTLTNTGNITASGTINGIVIKKGNYTVTPTNNVLIDKFNSTFYSIDCPPILPFDSNRTYTGSIKFIADASGNINYRTDNTTINNELLTINTTATTFSFTDIRYLKLWRGTAGNVRVYDFTLT